MISVPSAQWRMLNQRICSKPLTRGLETLWNSGSGYLNRLMRSKKIFQKQAEKIIAMEECFSEMSDVRLREKAEQLRVWFRCGRDTQDHLNESVALVREVACRQIGKKPFPVQVAGALAMVRGCIAEMATGEGKTLAATMAVTIAGWRGRGCHVITVNDYLAKRDAQTMKPIYQFCGLSTAWLEEAMPLEDRRRAYQADLTYCSNKEVTADFLRDQVHMNRLNLGSALLEKMVAGNHVFDTLLQRGLHYAFVDEADSVLIDEAVTPLILSGDAPNTEQAEIFGQAAEIAQTMAEGTHYTADRRYRAIELTDDGKCKLNAWGGKLGGVWTRGQQREELIVQAICAREFFQRDKQYVVEKDKIIIVDEFTGRLMADRAWRNGLHQAIEAKENVPINAPRETLARISFQRFFRAYQKLAGMTGTAGEARGEFWQIYNLPVVTIPTHKPCIRKILPTVLVRTQQEKWQAILSEVAQFYQSGRPILIGTRSIQASEYLSQLLNSKNLPHQVLNAVQHHKEAQIVADAGQRGKITVATNMAGRGTDIKLGSGVADLGGLHVIATERHESSRIDRQLFGRAARQGDPGSVRAIISLEDELVRQYANKIAALLNNEFRMVPARTWPVLARGVFGLSQFRAQWRAYRQRTSVLRTDQWLDENLSFAGSEYR